MKQRTQRRTLLDRRHVGYKRYGLNQNSRKLLAVQDVQRHVGERIRKLRSESGYTQEIFAERAGLNRTHMSDIERGLANVTIQTLKLIADTLGVKITDLVKGV